MHLAIVGNSAAGLSALEAFRARDRGARVTLVSAEPGPAYSRVLLPYFLRGKIAREGMFIRTSQYYAEHAADVQFGRRVERVDAAAQRLEFSDGGSLGFDRLLLATGSSPARPPIPGLDGAGISHLWTLDDALRLDEEFRPGRRLLVLGAGFVALQAAWAALCRGLQVTVVELMDQVLPRILDPAAARILAAQLEARGVELHLATRTEAVERDASGRLRLTAAGLPPLIADLMIVGTGVRPNAGLLPEAVEPGTHGILVTHSMETMVEGVYAAGDVVRGPVCGFDRCEIHALWTTAIEQGHIAGLNLAGEHVLYDGSLSMNVTEMFGLTVASLGDVDDAAGDRVETRQNESGLRYLKFVSRGAVPLGAVALGGPEAAGILGRLRPFVRNRRPLAETDTQALLEGRELSRRLSPGAVAAQALGRAF